MGPAPDVSSFIELLAALPDPRVERTRRHSLESILFLCLCGTVCGANDLVAIEDFGIARRAFLEKFVDFPNGIPPHDTIGRVLAKLDPTALEQMFTKWMRGVAEATKRDVVAIDGKVLRRALDKASGAGFITMVGGPATRATGSAGLAARKGSAPHAGAAATRVKTEAISGNERRSMTMGASSPSYSRAGFLALRAAGRGAAALAGALAGAGASGTAGGSGVGAAGVAEAMAP